MIRYLSGMDGTVKMYLQKICITTSTPTARRLTAGSTLEEAIAMAKKALALPHPGSRKTTPVVAIGSL